MKKLPGFAPNHSNPVLPRVTLQGPVGDLGSGKPVMTAGRKPGPRPASVVAANVVSDTLGRMKEAANMTPARGSLCLFACYNEE